MELTGYDAWYEENLIPTTGKVVQMYRAPVAKAA